MGMAKHIVVIGGGIAGTSAAHALTERGFIVTIIDKNDYIGGRMYSQLFKGAAIEMGAGFMTKIYTDMMAFLRSNGLDAQLCSHKSVSGILRNGQVRMATIHTLAGNDALSWRAKLSLLPFIAKAVAHWPQLDHHAFWKAYVYDNRSVAAMFSKPNDELLEYLLQPMLNGYFYWSPEHVSEATLLCLCKAGLAQGGRLKMRGGLQCIPEAAAFGSTVLLGHTVRSVSRHKGRTYTVTFIHRGKQNVLQADGIVCATTASVIPAIFPGLNPKQAAFFEAVQYSSTALIARTYERDQTRDSMAIAFPCQEGIDLSTITLAREPGGTGDLSTLKTYASGTIGRQLCARSDKEIISTLTKLMDPVRETVLIGDPQPVATHVQRWPEALPCFDVGHIKRLRSFVEGEIEDPDDALVFAGDYLDGPFMEGAFRSGQLAAERLSRCLS